MKPLATLALLCALGAFADDEDSRELVRLRAAAAGLLSADPETREKSRQEVLSAGRAALPVLREEKNRRTDPGEIAALTRVIQVLSPEVTEREAVDCRGPFALSQDGKGYAVREADGRNFVKQQERKPLVPPAPGGRRGDLQPKAQAFAFTSGGDVAVAWDSGRSVTVFDARSGEKSGSLDDAPSRNWHGGFADLRCLQSGALLAAGPERGVVFLQGGEPVELTLGALQPHVRAWAIQPSGILAIRVDPLERSVLLRWNPQNWKLVDKVPIRVEKADLLGASRDGPTVVVASTTTAQVSRSDDGGREFGPPIASDLPPGDLLSLAVSPDGTWVALGSARDLVQLRLATTWELLRELKCSGPVRDLAFSDDGSALAAQATEKLHIFDVRPR